MLFATICTAVGAYVITNKVIAPVTIYAVKKGVKVVTNVIGKNGKKENNK